MSRAPGPGGSAQAAGSNTGPLENAMAAITITDGPPPPTIVRPPPRPAYVRADNGETTVVLANYFRITLRSVPTFTRYTLNFRFENGTIGTQSIRNTDEDAQPKGKKLKALVRHLLQQLNVPCASDFQQYLVMNSANSLGARPLSYRCTSVDDRDKDRIRTETWRVELKHMIALDMQDLGAYVADSNPSNGTLQDFDDHLQAISIIIGHSVRENDDVLGIGKSRFFGLATDSKSMAARRSWSPLPTDVHRCTIEVLRGCFQSVRASQSGPLLNVNPTYGAFRLAGNNLTLADILKRKDLGQAPLNKRVLGGPDHINAHKWVKGLRVEYTTSKGTKMVKTVVGFATQADGWELPSNLRPNGHPDYSNSTFLGGPRHVAIRPRYYGDPPYPEGVEVVDNQPYRASTPVYEFQRAIRGPQMQVNANFPLINIGTVGKPMYAMAEHCRIIENQPTKVKPSIREQVNLIKYAVQPPESNIEYITNEGSQLLGLHGQDHMNSLGVRVSMPPRLLEVKSRCLRAPVRQYASAKGTTDMETPAKWNMAKLHVWNSSRDPVPWGFVHFAPQQDKNIRTKLFGNQGLVPHLIHRMKINLKPNPLFSRCLPEVKHPEFSASANDFFGTLEENLPPSGILFVVLPDEDPLRYRTIKILGDIKYGVQTVCMVHEKMGKGPSMDPSYATNVGLKVNLKIGGCNHILKDGLTDVGTFLRAEQTMIMGYDVVHPTHRPPPEKDNAHADDGKSGTSKSPKPPKHQNLKGKASTTHPGATSKRYPPSMVALVANKDRHMSQWPVAVWDNPSGVETVSGDNFENAIFHHLRTWHLTTKDYNATRNGPKGGPLPKNLIIFRDGVSESQHQMVLDVELPCIVRACQRARNFVVPGTPMPAITLVVAVKRHQTRFYPVAPTKSEDGKTTKPGTVVDCDITIQNSWDFYLQAHQAIKGTPRPAHYIVLKDEVFRNNASSPENAAKALEDLTHRLSYIFGRATKAVSICTPAYYADIACTRAKLHREEVFERDDLTEDYWKAVVKQEIHERLKNTMYYI